MTAAPALATPATRPRGLSLERGSKRQLLGDTAKSRGRAIAAKRKRNDLWSMKKLTLLSLIGITSIALTQPGWAAGHGGGGGGFHGGGFGGGHFGGGGGFRGGGFRGGGGHFGGGGFGAPHMSFGGTGNRGGGVSFGMPRTSGGVPHIANRAANVHSFGQSRPLARQSSGGRPTPGLTNVARGNRTGNTSGRATAALNRPNNRGMNPSTARPSQTSPHRGLNGRTDHIAER